MTWNRYTLVNNQTVNVGYFTNLQNAGDLTRQALAGKLKCCIADASLICNVGQAVTAANRACMNAMRSALKTKGVYTEMLFYIGPGNNLHKTLERAGLKATCTAIVVIMLDATEEQLKAMEEGVEGSMKPVEALTEQCEKPGYVEETIKMYKLKDPELKIEKGLTQAELLQEAMITYSSMKGILK